MGWLIAIALAACAPPDAGQPPVVVGPVGVDGGSDGGPVDAGAPMDRGPVDGALDAPADPDAAPDRAVDAAPPALDAAPDAAPDPEPDMGPPPPRRVVHVELGPAVVGEPVVFDLPAGLEALLIQARGAPDGVYRVGAIEGPGGSLIGPEAGRATLNPEVAVALLPNTGRFEPLPGGRYTVTFGSAGPDARPLAGAVFGLAGLGERLAVTVHVPPTVRAADDPAVLAMAAALEAQLAVAFAVEAAVAVAALPAGSPDALEVDGAQLDFAGLVALSAAAGEAAGAGVDVFLLAGIADAGAPLTGFSGGLPAPFGVGGSAAGVVAVPASLIDDFPDAVADRAAHEVGHALGLFHTTGAFGTPEPIGDTPTCPLACDADGDGVLFARECGARGRGDGPCRGASDNLMFWTLGGERTVTPMQRAVVRRHPFVE